MWQADAGSIDKLCARIVDGESQARIAETLGIGRSELTRWIGEKSERSARVQSARACSAVTWDEKAELEIRQASDPFELAKAKELSHHYRWRASKVSPDYGEKIQHGGANDLPPIAMTGELAITPGDAYMRMLGAVKK